MDFMNFSAFPGFPYQSKFIENDIYGNPVFDRAVDSVFYRTYWKKYFTDGIFPNPATNFQVMAAGGLNVTVRAGTCHIQGTTNALLSDTTLTLPVGTTQNIIYRIVIRAEFDNNRLPIL